MARGLSNLQHPDFSNAWNAAICPAPDIEHLTPPGCHLCIGIHVCMLTFRGSIRFGKFRLWLKKKSTGPLDQFLKINCPEPKFFPGQRVKNC